MSKLTVEGFISGLMLGGPILRVSVSRMPVSILYPAGQIVTETVVFCRDVDTDGNKFYPGFRHISKLPSDSYNDSVGLEAISLGDYSPPAEVAVTNILMDWEERHPAWLKPDLKVACYEEGGETGKKMFTDPTILTALVRMQTAVGYEIRVADGFGPTERRSGSSGLLPIGIHIPYGLCVVYYYLDSVINKHYQLGI